MAKTLDQTVFDPFCYWQGVPTLFRCPHDPNPANCDIGLIGVPHSSGNGTTERDQHLGPRALRDMSMGYRRCHGEYRIDPWNICKINDLGDPPMPNAMVNDVTVKEIEAFFKKVDGAGCRPVSIGGDHSIPLPILRAIASADSKINGGEPVAMVHFDAHLDTYPMDLLGVREHAGAWGYLMNEEGLVDAEKVVQIGIRGHPIDLALDEYSIQSGYRVIYKKEFDEIGVERVIKEVRARIPEGKPTYITFDLDSLDPVYAPAVSNIEPGYPGLTMWEAMRVLHGLRGLNIVGGDVVCPMPTKDDPSKITSINTAVIMFEIICLVADWLDNH
jgi:guanidinopropionase